MNKKSLTRERKSIYQGLMPFLIVLSSFLVVFAPLQGDNTINIGVFRLIFLLVQRLSTLLLIVLLFLRLNRNGFAFEEKNFILLFVPIVYHFFYFFDSYESFPPLNGLNYIMMLLYVFCTSDERFESFTLARKFLVLLSAAGIVCWVSYVFKLGIPYTLASFYGKNVNNFTYVDYKICYLYQNFIEIRLCGLFNEPGFFGTVLAFFLCADNLNFKKVSNIIMFIAGCFTLSMAFFAIILVFLLLKLIQKPIGLITVILFGLMFLYVVNNVETGNPAVDNLLKRFAFSDGKISGDNRTSEELTAVLSNDILNGPRFLFGYGTGFVSALGGANAGLKVDIVNYGVIGSLFVFGSFFIAALRMCAYNRIAVSYVIVFMISLYQRSNIFGLWYFVICFGGIEYIKHTQVHSKPIFCNSWALRA